MQLRGLLLTLAIATAKAPPAPPDDIAHPFSSFPVWPLPTSSTWTPTAAGVVCPLPAASPPRLHFRTSPVPLLTSAWDRIASSVFAGVPPSTPSHRFPHHPPLRSADAASASASFGGRNAVHRHNCSPLEVVEVEVASEVPLELGVDESYTLDVTFDSETRRPRCVLTAKTQWGALRGVSSLAQLFVWDGEGVGSGGGGDAEDDADDGGVFLLPNLPIHISDAPEWGWRGLLLDTARHFLPMRDMVRVLDLMEANKLNVRVGGRGGGSSTRTTAPVFAPSRHDAECDSLRRW